MKNLFLLLIAILLAVFEGTVFTLPIVFIYLNALYIKKRNLFMFVVAFVGGFILDVISLRSIGLSSLFFVSSLFVVGLYEKKFEIKTNWFILLSSLLGSFAYLLLVGNHDIIKLSLVSSLLALILFKLL